MNTNPLHKYGNNIQLHFMKPFSHLLLEFIILLSLFLHILLPMNKPGKRKDLLSFAGFIDDMKIIIFNS